MAPSPRLVRPASYDARVVTVPYKVQTGERMRRTDLTTPASQVSAALWSVPRARLSVERRGAVEDRIIQLRGLRVLLDADLAQLYGVSTGRLNEAVRRNAPRFPDDFMIRLTPAGL